MVRLLFACYRRPSMQTKLISQADCASQGSECAPWATPPAM